MLSREERDKLVIDSTIYLCYDYLFAIANNRILATHGDKISLITTDGEMLCTYDSIYVPTYPSKEYYDESEDRWIYDEEFMDDILVFIDDGKLGVLDYDGDIVLEAKYRDITFNTAQELELLP